MTTKLFKTVVPFLGAVMLVQAGEWSGEISASDVRVSVGEIPNVQWNVTYPVATVEDVIVIDDGEIIPKRCLDMEVRLLGASWGDPYQYYYVFGELHVNSDDIQLLFGTHDLINSSDVVFNSLVQPGDTIRSSAKGYFSKSFPSSPNSGNWGTLYNSWDNTPNVVLLKNGDDAPQLTAGYAMQQDVEDHLAPYMDSTTGKMTLGPRDVVYLFDFNDVDSSGYDLQDFCVLITFIDAECGGVVVADTTTTAESGKTNNGHGNNVDGIDVSNPGQGDGGPNGMDDTVTDGVILDDESKGGGAAPSKTGW